MKSFDTFINDAESLNERSFQSLLKTGSVLTAARASKRYGDAAVKELQKVSSTLDKPIPNNAKDPKEERLERIEKSLLALSQGMISMRFQLGSITALATSAALLADKNSKQHKIKHSSYHFHSSDMPESLCKARTTMLK